MHRLLFAIVVQLALRHDVLNFPAAVDMTYRDLSIKGLLIFQQIFQGSSQIPGFPLKLDVMESMTEDVPCNRMNDVCRVQIAQCSVHKSGALLLEDREGQFWDENLVRSSRAGQPLQQQCTLGELHVKSLSLCNASAAAVDMYLQRFCNTKSPNR